MSQTKKAPAKKELVITPLNGEKVRYNLLC